MIPRVGMAASVYGLAAPLLGLPSVGDMALAVRDTNEFDLNASLAKPSRSGDGGERLVGARDTNGAARAPAPATAPSERFASTYLGFSDPTARPTPEQKWGASGTPNEVAYSL